MNADNQLPNILLIMSDEHDPAVTGCYGDSLVQTPHLDALAAEGVTFENCYCNSPLCCPSRLSLTASQYPSRCGAWGNNCRLPSDEYPSFPRALRAAGYDAFLCGKQHYDRDHRYGFTDIFPEVNSSKQTGIEGRRDASNLTPRTKAWERRSADFRAGDHSLPMDLDRSVSCTARGFLAGRRPEAGPFFLMAGYLAPHFPLIAPQAYTDRYAGKTPPPIAWPNSPHSSDLCNNLPLNYQHLRAFFGVEAATPEQIQKGRDMYWALVDWFDDEAGRLLTALDESVHAENTLVIYTSDHGENKGDHGLWWKSCMYDHGARVPLIVRWPKRWAGGQRRTQVCSLVDVVQTIVAMAGGQPQPGSAWDGDSLLGVLDNPQTNWKDFALSEYHGGGVASGITMYREGRWKYVYHARADETYGPERELYDMEHDPQELQNLAHDPNQTERIAALHTAMVNELGAEPNDIEQRFRSETAQPYD